MSAGTASLADILALSPRLGELWVYLAASPLLGLTLTLVAYQAAWWAHRKSGGSPLANPVLLAVALLVTVLTFSGTDYHTYFDGAQFVHFLLGPATVALAIPLHAQWPRLKAMAGPLTIALVAGSLTAALSAWGLGALLGGSRESLMSLAPKSVTTPIAMGVADWKVPGLSVAVVKDGQVVFAKGYGVRELGQPEPVSTRTLFAVGSTTKAMTAALAFAFAVIGWAAYEVLR